MPTEFEFKYVLSLESSKWLDRKTLEKYSTELLLIKQGYLAFSKGMTLRVRSITIDGKEKWFLTFKQKIGSRVVEIETKLDKRDGEDLWSVCVGRLKKDRYVIKDEGYVWELDFFRNGGNLYFVQLEVELEEGESRPKQVPKFLRSYVLYEVPLTDDRFSNKRLADVEYAHLLYQKIKEGKLHEFTEDQEL